MRKGNNMKKCKGCEVEKPLESFHKNKKMKDGYLNYCGKCKYKKYSKKQSEYVKNRRKLYPEQYRSIKGMHQARFEGLREKVLERDNYKCVDCGMENKEHQEKWNRDLTLNHIDGTGRNNYDHKLPSNNDIDNLETLCLRCHGRKDSIRYWRGGGKES